MTSCTCGHTAAQHKLPPEVDEKHVRCRVCCCREYEQKTYSIDTTTSTFKQRYYGIVLFAILFFGCARLQPETRGPKIWKSGQDEIVPTAAPQLDRDECRSLDSKQLGWSVGAIVVGGLAGASGGVTALVPDSVPKYVTGSISLVLAIFSGVSTFLTTRYTKRYADGCTVNIGGK